MFKNILIILIPLFISNNIAHKIHNLKKLSHKKMINHKKKNTLKKKKSINKSIQSRNTKKKTIADKPFKAYNLSLKVTNCLPESHNSNKQDPTMSNSSLTNFLKKDFKNNINYDDNIEEPSGEVDYDNYSYNNGVVYDWDMVMETHELNNNQENHNNVLPINLTNYLIINNDKKNSSLKDIIIENSGNKDYKIQQFINKTLDNKSKESNFVDNKSKEFIHHSNIEDGKDNILNYSLNNTINDNSSSSNGNNSNNSHNNNPEDPNNLNDLMIKNITNNDEQQNDKNTEDNSNTDNTTKDINTNNNNFIKKKVDNKKYLRNPNKKKIIKPYIILVNKLSPWGEVAILIKNLNLKWGSPNGEIKFSRDFNKQQTFLTQQNNCKNNSQIRNQQPYKWDFPILKNGMDITHKFFKIHSNFNLKNCNSLDYNGFFNGYWSILDNTQEFPMKIYIGAVKNNCANLEQFYLDKNLSNSNLLGDLTGPKIEVNNMGINFKIKTVDLAVELVHWSRINEAKKSENIKSFNIKGSFHSNLMGSSSGLLMMGDHMFNGLLSWNKNWNNHGLKLKLFMDILQLKQFTNIFKQTKFENKDKKDYMKFLDKKFFLNINYDTKIFNNWSFFKKLFTNSTKFSFTWGKKYYFDNGSAFDQEKKVDSKINNNECNKKDESNTKKETLNEIFNKNLEELKSLLQPKKNPITLYGVIFMTIKISQEYKYFKWELVFNIFDTNNDIGYVLEGISLKITGINFVKEKNWAIEFKEKNYEIEDKSMVPVITL